MFNFNYRFYILTIIVLIALTFKISDNYLLISKKQNVNTPKMIDSIIILENKYDFGYFSAQQGVNYEIPLFPYYFEDISVIPEFTLSISNFVLSQSEISPIVSSSFNFLSAGAGGVGPPVVASKQIRNDDELNQVIRTSDIIIKSKDLYEWNKLPFELKKNIIQLYISISVADEVMSSFSKPICEYLFNKNITTINETYQELTTLWQTREMIDFTFVDLLDFVDLKKLSFASRLITEQLNKFLKIENEFNNLNFSKCQLITQHGKIMINGTKNDTIYNNSFITIDLGGNDFYTGNVASSISLKEHYGIIVDFNGDDKYIGDKGFVACGVLGFAAILDLRGNDQYINTKNNLCFSLFGTSIIYDCGGDDNYFSSCERSQASSIFGVSVLEDLQGNDTYNCNSYSQGFGGTMGIGLFIDKQGNDLYNTKISSSSLPHFVQGSSKGRWATVTDGQSLAGGLGIFLDKKGDDIYYANSFSQGASYYFGFGVFLDESGDDFYNATSHSQGYAAHFSIANFIDKIGNDNYNQNVNTNEITQIIGSGRDLSAGVFIDYSGNDNYVFGNRSLAVGDINGVGVFIDLNGNDNYTHICNSINKHSLSTGKINGESSNIKILRLFPVEDYGFAIFYDKNGKNNFLNRKCDECK